MFDHILADSDDLAVQFTNFAVIVCQNGFQYLSDVKFVLFKRFVKRQLVKQIARGVGPIPKVVDEYIRSVVSDSTLEKVVEMRMKREKRKQRGEKYSSIDDLSQHDDFLVRIATSADNPTM